MQKRRAMVFLGSRPTGHFIMKLTAFMGVFLFAYREDMIGRLLEPWVELTAGMTVALLHALGTDALRAGSQIHHPGGFAYEIYYRCTGVLPAALLSALILASAACLRRKLVGMALGIGALIGVNLLRLVHLFLLGVYRPALFEVSHGVVWELITAAITLGLWWTWSRWAVRCQLQIRTD